MPEAEARETHVRLLAELEEARERLAGVVENAPIGICVFRGHDLVYELANPAYCRIGPGKKLIGRRYEDVWPEAAEPYRSIMRTVLDTGEPFSSSENLVQIRRSHEGPLEDAYFNIFFTRLPPDVDGEAGVLTLAVEITDQVRDAAALRESEARNRTLIDSMDEGFCIIEVLFDENDKPFDYWFVETNAAFEGHTGLQDVEGRTIREMVPDHDAHWFELYGSVARTGVAERVEQPATAMGRFYDVSAYRIGPAGSNQVAVFFRDMTERRNHQERFRIIAEANELLLVADNPETVIQTIAEQVMDHLNADVFFNYVLDQGASRLRLNAWGGVDQRVAQMIERLELGQAICGCVARDGERIISEEVQHNEDPRADLVRRMGVRCYACHPLQVTDRTIGTLSFGTKSKDTFEDDEIELMRAIANQISIAMQRVYDGRQAAFQAFLLESVSDAVIVYQLEGPEAGTLVFVNEAAHTQRGYSREEMLDLNVADLIAPEWRTKLPERMGVLALGEDLRAESAHLRKDGSQFPVEVWLRGVEFGGRRLVVNVSRDMTDHKDAETRLTRALEAERAELARTKVLQDVAAACASSLEVEELAERVLDVVHTSLNATIGAVYSLATPTAGVLVAGFGLAAEELERIRSVEVDDSTLAGRAIITGQIQTANTDAAPSKTAERTRRWNMTDLSLVDIPLRVKGRNVGVLGLGFSPARPFTAEETELLCAIANQLAVAVRNSQLYQTEHRIAETLQDTLVALPKHIDGVKFSRAYESATHESGRVGGDFIDLFEVSPHVVGFTLGDVSGKGIDAAVTTSLVRTTIRVHAVDGLAPAEIATRANAVMRRFSETESFVTLWFGLLNTETGLLRYISAGHPPAIVLTDDAVAELGQGGPILGAFDDVRYHDSQAVLAEDERLVLYSDGVTEAKSSDGPFLDATGLYELLKARVSERTENMASAVMEDIIAFSNGVLRDDAAILVVARDNRKAGEEQRPSSGHRYQLTRLDGSEK